MFLKAIGQGDWEHSLRLCDKIDFADSLKRKEVQIMILERKLVEYIEGHNIHAVINCLRYELKPLITDINRSVSNIWMSVIFLFLFVY